MCWMLQQKLKNICQKKGENKKRTNVFGFYTSWYIYDIMKPTFVLLSPC